MKNLATPLGLAGFGSHSEADRSRNQFFDWRVVAIALFVFAGYFLGAKIGFALTFRPHPVSVLWPPNSILLAALLLTPVRIWWVILLAAFPAHLAAQLQSNVPPTMILCWFIHQQHVRSTHWRGLCPVPDRSSGAVRSPSKRRNFLLLRCVSGAVSFFLSGRGLRRHQSLGARQLLASLATPIYFERFSRANPRAFYCGLERGGNRLAR